MPLGFVSCVFGRQSRVCYVDLDSEKKEIRLESKEQKKMCC
jgi:hypothetical protein